jgi:hypothetical protein
VPFDRCGGAQEWQVVDTALAYLYCMEQAFGTGIVLTIDGGTVLV